MKNTDSMYMVYQLTNRINGKRYIGFTKDFHSRLYRHCISNFLIGRAIRKYGLHNFRITIIHFNLSEEKASIAEKRLIAKRQTLSPEGYNIHEGGLGGNTLKGLAPEQKTEHYKKVSKANTGSVRSAETRRKMSEAQKGRTFSEETRKKMSEAQKRNQKGALNNFYGKTHSEETRKKLSDIQKVRMSSEENLRKLSEAKRGKKNSCYGKPLSEEHRQKISEAKKGRPRSKK